MIRKKILVHGTADSLQKFFADAVSRDYEFVAILSDAPEKISVAKLEVFAPKNLPAFTLKLVDAIIFTADKSSVELFLRRGLAPRKIILWDAARGWEFFSLRDADGTQRTYFCGLEFHIRNDDDAKFFGETRWRMQIQRQVKNLNPQFYPAVLAQGFRQRMRRPLNLNNPRTFTEKLQWIKLYDAAPIKSRLADKYLVRRWIADKIGAQYLIPLLGVWDDFDDIDFDDLPDQFVLKCNHGSGMNVIVRDKSTFDKRAAREKINAWLAFDYSALCLELHYTRIKRKIIAEKFMADGDLPQPTDYKFYTFGGKPVYCLNMSDRATSLKQDFFDMNWHVTNIVMSDYPPSDHPENIAPPKNFELMKKLAATLAEGFDFVRVDFYEVDGHVYFGEMTFTPGAGNFYYKSAGTDEYLGSLLTLPAPTPPIHIDNTVAHRVRKKFMHEVKFPPPPKPPAEHKIIASLTSWTKRIGTAHLAIQTILNQTRRPDLTVLYLATEEFPRREKNLPRELLALKSDRFEIRWTKNIRPYKKLIPALKDFPDDIIITFDDDIFYRAEVVELLLIGYRAEPNCIQCHRATTVSLTDSGDVKFSALSYDKPAYCHKFTGVGGVLYPPHYLDDKIFDEKTFMRLAPTNDDVWFWAQTLLNGRRVNVVPNNLDALNYIPDTQDVGLFHENDGDKKLTLSYVENILNAYPVLRDILRYEQRLAEGD